MSLLNLNENLAAYQLAASAAINLTHQMPGCVFNVTANAMHTYEKKKLVAYGTVCMSARDEALDVHAVEYLDNRTVDEMVTILLERFDARRKEKFAALKANLA